MLEARRSIPRVQGMYAYSSNPVQAEENSYIGCDGP